MKIFIVVALFALAAAAPATLEHNSAYPVEYSMIPRGGYGFALAPAAPATLEYNSAYPVQYSMRPRGGYGFEPENEGDEKVDDFGFIPVDDNQPANQEFNVEFYG